MSAWPVRVLSGGDTATGLPTAASWPCPSPTGHLAAAPSSPFIYLASLRLSHLHCIFRLLSPYLHLLLCHKQGTLQDPHTFLAADLVLHSNMKNKIPSGKDVLHNEDCEVVLSWSQLNDVCIASDVVAKKNGQDKCSYTTSFLNVKNI